MNEQVLQLEFEPVAVAARDARRAVRAWITAAALPARVGDDVLLVVSELVTNAAIHARTTARVVVRWNGSCALVEVFDADSHPPVLRDPARAVGGWGLHLVDQLSRVWGTEVLSVGKRVWAEVVGER